MKIDELINIPPKCAIIRPASDLFNPTEKFSDFYHIKSQLIVDRISSKKPIISIMIPTYRRPELLRHAIKSALEQKTQHSFEVVVIDNESHDSSIQQEMERTIDSFGDANLRYFRNTQNIGPMGNWNRCVELARGEWVTILNDDDLLDPFFVSEMFDLVLRTNTLFGVCAHRSFGIKMKSYQKFILWKSAKFIFHFIELLSSIIFHSQFLSRRKQFSRSQIPGTLGVLFNRNAFFSLGGFSSAFYPSCDGAFWWRATEVFRFSYTPKTLAYYRWEDNDGRKPDVEIGCIYILFILRNMMIDRCWGKRNIIGKGLCLLNRLYASICLSIRCVSEFRGYSIFIYMVTIILHLINFFIGFGLVVKKDWFLVKD